MISTYEFDKEKLMNTPPEKLHELYDDYFLSILPERPDSTSDRSRYWVLRRVMIEDSILEVGSGVSLLGLSLFGNTYRYPVLSDFSFEACRFIKISVSCYIACYDAHYIPFRDNSFDSVVCSHTLEHVVNPVDVLREMVRVSTKRVIIVVPDYISSDKSADYHFHNFPHIRALDKIVDAVCPFFSVEYEHLTESGEICCCIDVGVIRGQKISIRQ